MAKAYSYVRMSTELQLRGDSLRRQSEASAKYAAENGLELVDDADLHDIGVSAFRGANATSGALSKFLAAIDDGKVSAGSYLLVESLDRLSRESVLSALNLFLRITQSGIHIVTLADSQLYAAGKADLHQLLYSIMVMSRANEESVTKSRRIAAAWSQKRSKIEERKLTRTCPAWLRLRDDRTAFEIIPENVDTVKLIFRMCIEGYGLYGTTRYLNQNDVKPFGKTRGWNQSYVSKILRNRAVIGEFQPHKYIDGKRIPEGDVISDYYPAIIDEAVFYSALSATRGRQYGAAGRKGNGVPNIFGQLLRCGKCGNKARVINKGEGPRGGRHILCADYDRGLRCTSQRWNYSHFETAFLLFSNAVDLSKIIGAVEAREAQKDIEIEIIAEREKLEQIKEDQERTFQLFLSKKLNFLEGKLEDLEHAIEVSQSRIKQLELKINTEDYQQPVSGVALMNLIEQVRNPGPDEAQSDRIRLMDRLRHYISKIEVQFDASALLASAGISSLVGRARAFTILFKDGSVRLIAVDSADPPNMLVDSFVDEKGSATVRAEGRSDWHRNPNLSNREIDEILAFSNT